MTTAMWGDSVMKKATILCALLWLLMPIIVCAQAGSSSSATKLASGSIRSVDASTLVVRSEANGKDENFTFVLTAQTRKEGDVVRGADAIVQYRVEGEKNIAVFVQAKPAELETLEYAKSQISLDGEPKAHITSGNNVVVEGSGTNHDKFQHDILLTATLFDSAGRAVGTATGRLEDLQGGHSDKYQLTGTVTSTTWTRVSVVISNVTEHVQRAPGEKKKEE